MFKINTNVIGPINNWSGIGAAVKDDKGEVLVATTWKIRSEEMAPTVEAIGIKKALIFALDMCFMAVRVESNWLPVIQSIHRSSPSNSYLESLALIVAKLLEIFI